MERRSGLLSRYSLNFKLIREIDKGLLLAMIGLMVYGMINIYLCTKGDVAPFFFVKKQFMWFVISLITLYLLVAIDYSIIFRYVPVFYWGSVFLLLCVWIPVLGVRVNGARGWINIGVSSLQPAELAKFGIILMVAKLLDEMDYNINNVKNIVKIFIYCMIPVSLILIQPDMGMTMVCFFIVLGMLYIAGLDRRIIIGGFSILLIGIVLLWNSGLILPHQKGRITAFMNPETDTSDNGYQLNQSLIGIGSGGFSGSKPTFDSSVAPGYSGTHVPEVQTDFIFAAIAEQWGLLGALLLFFLYGVLITKMINIARRAKDRYASIICIGLVSYFLFAITQNVGMTMGIIPITGITLPFISYGGSSLLTTTVAAGLVLNIGMRKKKIHF